MSIFVLFRHMTSLSSPYHKYSNTILPDLELFKKIVFRFIMSLKIILTNYIKHFYEFNS